LSRQKPELAPGSSHRGRAKSFSAAHFPISLRAYDVNGRLAPVSSYKKIRAERVFRILRDGAGTLIAVPSILDFRAKPPGQSYAGMGVLQAGARVKLYDLDEWMFSAQGTLREATNTRSRVDMGHGLQADVRLLIGRTFTLLGFPAFSSLEIGYRRPAVSATRYALTRRLG
jgi:hypothetical protein